MIKKYSKLILLSLFTFVFMFIHFIFASNYLSYIEYEVMYLYVSETVVRITCIITQILLSTGLILMWQSFLKGNKK